MASLCRLTRPSAKRLSSPSPRESHRRATGHAFRRRATIIWERSDSWRSTPSPKRASRRVGYKKTSRFGPGRWQPFTFSRERRRDSPAPLRGNGSDLDDALSEEGFKKGSIQKDIALRAWQVGATYILTGEKKGFTSPTPRKSFDPRNHGWGAFELAARVGDFSAGKGIYNYGFASAAATPRHAHEWVGGVNWYLNRLVKISVDYGNT